MFDTYFNDHESLTVQIVRYSRLYAAGVFGHLDRQTDASLCMISFSVKNGHLQLNLFPDHALFRELLEPQLATIESCLPNRFKDSKDLASNSINLKSLVVAILENSPDLSSYDLIVSDFSYFDNQVSGLTTLYSKSHRESHYQLSGKHDGLPTSFFEAIYYEYRSEMSRFLNQISRGYLAVNLDFNDTVRKAAKQLLKHLGYKGLWDTSYNKIRKIAQAKFNNQYPKGTLCFVHSPENMKHAHSPGHLIAHPNLEYTVVFREAIPLGNYRYVRKLLNLTSSDIVLVCNPEHVIGIARIIGDYDFTREDIFTVNFVGMNAWDFGNGYQKMLRIHGDKISLPDSVLDYGTFKKTWYSKFTTVSHASTDLQLNLNEYIPNTQDKERLRADIIRSFYRLFTSLCRDRIEASIIITTDAALESNRLSNQGFLTQPIKINHSTAKTLSRLGDAMILSPEGVCYAVGVTLDGLASEKIDHAKGYRYNTAIRYIQTRNLLSPQVQILAVLTNEDGTMDICEV